MPALRNERHTVGSFPRLRGTRNLPHPPAQASRFIPTPAGNAWPRPEPRRHEPVHPRACGERRLELVERRAHVRFIPAPAGNAQPSIHPVPPSPVHPRACGERPYPAWVAFDADGSSPRLRGTLLALLVRAAKQRFIPAPAGNAVNFVSERRTVTVHPRACGERIINATLNRPRSGSSPRLRGTRMPPPGPALGERFIPAPAGNASRRRNPHSGQTVHPRACGERASVIETMNPPDGSSPRLRGTRRQQQWPTRRWRFIPAPAGNAAR